MHTLSANEQDGKLILDGPIFDAPPFMTEDRFEPGPDYIPFWQVSTSRIGRWVIDLKTGKATSERLGDRPVERSEEHTSELQSLMRISYAVFCLKKNKNQSKKHTIEYQ